MVDFEGILEYMENPDESPFGDNPDPHHERYERYLVEISFLKNSSRKKSQEFYDKIKSFDQRIYIQPEEKRSILEEYCQTFRSTRVDSMKNITPDKIRKMNPLKRGRLFNKVLKEMEDMLKQ